MEKMLRVVLALAAACVLFSGDAEAAKRIKVVNVDWLKPHVATLNGRAFQAVGNIAQDGTRDTTEWFDIADAAWNPLIDNYFQLVTLGSVSSTVSAPLMPQSPGLLAQAIFSGLSDSLPAPAMWVNIASDSLVSTLTSCSLYVQTAGPADFLQLGSMNTGDTWVTTHQWFACANNVADNLSSYSLPAPTSLAANLTNAPWVKGHTRARAIIVGAGGIMRKARVQVVYWSDKGQ